MVQANDIPTILPRGQILTAQLTTPLDTVFIPDRNIQLPQLAKKYQEPRVHGPEIAEEFTGIAIVCQLHVYRCVPRQSRFRQAGPGGRNHA